MEDNDQIVIDEKALMKITDIANAIFYQQPVRFANTRDIKRIHFAALAYYLEQQGVTPNFLVEPSRQGQG